MQTKTINLYTIEELKTQIPKAFDKAIQNYRDDNQLDYLQEFIQEELTTLLEENKITTKNKPEMFYNLSYCQGDGAMFTLKNATWSKYPDYVINVTHSGHYNHSNSKTIVIERAESDNYDTAPDNVYTEFDDIYIDICKKLEKTGYSYIDSEHDENNIMENMNANEYTFTIDGKFEHAD